MSEDVPLHRTHLRTFLPSTLGPSALLPISVSSSPALPLHPPPLLDPHSKSSATARERIAVKRQRRVLAQFRGSEGRSVEWATAKTSIFQPGNKSTFIIVIVLVRWTRTIIRSCCRCIQGKSFYSHSSFNYSITIVTDQLSDKENLLPTL